MTNTFKHALTLKPGVFVSLKNDLGFTNTAWWIIIISSLLTSLGSNTSLLRTGRISAWLLGVFGTTIAYILGFVLACVAMVRVGEYFFDVKVSFDQVFRSQSISRIWLAITFIGIITILSPTLACMTGPIGFGAVMITLSTSLLALKEVFELDWPQLGVLLVIGLIVMVGVALIFNVILASLGLVSVS